MTKISKKALDRLKEQREKLNARIEAQETRLKVMDRKKDTRRKILLGSYLLDQAAKENKIHEIKAMMNTYLKRNSDRELFELGPLENTII